MPKTIGVAIASYNGMRFIGEQLDSISRQTVSPQLISISDDCSTDGTPELLREFESQSKIPVKLNFNSKQLGVIENFLIAFRQCPTDYIAYCDQDDVWRSDKIAICSDILNRTNASMVFHRSAIVDAALVSLARFEPANIKRGVYRRPHFPDNLWGLSHQMIFSREAYEVIRRIMTASSRTVRSIGEGLDYSILIAAGIVGDIYFLDQELTKFRRHDWSVSPAGKIIAEENPHVRTDTRKVRVQHTADIISAISTEIRNGDFKPTDAPILASDYADHMHSLARRYAQRRIIYESNSSWRRIRAMFALILSRSYGSVHSNKLKMRQLLLDARRSLVTVR